MGKRKKGDPLNGWLILDKPLGLSSTQALSKARRLLNAQKAGHAGTLDPLATGVLPLAFGEATKTIPFVQDAEKVYRFRVKWGSATTTDDSEGEVIESSESRPSKEDILKQLPTYTGPIQQIPPQFSAIKIDGKRAYALARKGEEVKIQPREVTIYSLDLIEIDNESAVFECECSKGTYVRALARDIGRDIGCFGHITELRRLAVGFFDVEDAISLDELQKMVQDAPPEDALLPVETPLDDIPALYLTESEASRLRHGQSVVLFSKDGQNRLNAAGLDPNCDNGTILARTDTKPVALIELNGVEVKPVRVLNV